jgi:TrmH family RNA methyltransferase
MVAATGVAAPAGVHCPVRTLSLSLFNRIAPSKTPQGLMAVVRIPAEALGDELPPDAGGDVLLCEHVQDPGNVGALIRSAAAFGFGGVVLSEDSADPFAPKAVQASAGALLSLWIRRTASYCDMAATLRSRGYRVAAADVRAEPGATWLQPGPVVLLLGSEAAGLSPRMLALADISFAIPTARERAESLNVAAAGAIAMYLLAHRREPRG